MRMMVKGSWTKRRAAVERRQRLLPETRLVEPSGAGRGEQRRRASLGGQQVLRLDACLPLLPVERVPALIC